MITTISGETFAFLRIWVILAMRTQHSFTNWEKTNKQMLHVRYVTISRYHQLSYYSYTFSKNLKHR